MLLFGAQHLSSHTQHFGSAIPPATFCTGDTLPFQPLPSASHPSPSIFTVNPVFSSPNSAANCCSLPFDFVCSSTLPQFNFSATHNFVGCTFKHAFSKFAGRLPSSSACLVLHVIILCCVSRSRGLPVSHTALWALRRRHPVVCRPGSGVRA